MIKIRYRDANELSPGLHAAAERHGRSTTVYLLSGLTAQERRAALRRLRLSARMGYCPRLPAGQLALALLADRIRITIGHAGAVFRLHPAGSTVPVMVLSGGAIAFLVLSTVSIRVLHNQRTTAQSSAVGTSPVASAAAIPISGASQGRAAGLGGGGPGQGSGNTQLTPPGSGGPGGSSLGTSPAQTRAGGRGQGTGSGTGGGGTAAGTTLSGGADPRPTSAAGAGTTPAAASTTPAAGATTPAAAAATSSSAAPKPAPSASRGGICLNLGPLGICLDI
jgi:hypothetical protein